MRFFLNFFKILVRIVIVRVVMQKIMKNFFDTDGRRPRIKYGAGYIWTVFYIGKIGVLQNGKSSKEEYA